ncbi:hypothetical protein VTO42DRAFT_3421 [Malbranchea cinnamomea]
MSLRLAMARSKAETSMQQQTPDSPVAAQQLRNPSSLKGKKKKKKKTTTTSGSKFVRMNANRNRKRKSSSLSGESSDLESFGDGEDQDTSEGEEEEDDEEVEEPATFAPSYGVNKRRKNHKTGLGKNRLKFTKHKGGRKLGRVVSGAESDFDDGSSVSSVSSVSVSIASDDSDDIYEQVNNVSGGEDEDVEREETEMILNSEYERELEEQLANAKGGDDWMGLDDLESRPFYSTGSLLDDDHLLLQTDDCDVVVEADFEEDANDTPVPPRVHFETTDNSDSDSSSTEDEFPDFLLQDSLDPDLRRMIENDGEPPSRPRSPHDIFISSDLYDIPGNIYHVESDTTVESSSEYETEGETTDEEDHPPPATITHPRSILRRESSASLSDRETSEQNPRPFRRRGPLRGTFIADPHKPVAVVAPNGKQLILIPPYTSSRHDWLESACNSLAPTANNGPHASVSVPNLQDDSDTDALSPTRRDSTPMLSSGANLMMSALQNNSGGQVMGPPEAFYPTTKYSVEASFEDDDEDSEAMLNVDDFIDFGDGSSDEDIGKDLADSVGLTTSPVVSSSVPGSLAPTPSRPGDSAQQNSAERLLNHLDRGIVTAFRRNHNRYQALIRLPHHREFMPAGSPSRAASAFRRSKLSDQKTPTRKRPASSYLAGPSVRRKLSGPHRLD